MFIEMPIKKFKLEENKLYLNNNIIEYEDISKDDNEILESLISKGAFGSALLTLNKLYSIKTINESTFTNKDYNNYLIECNKLMEYNTYKVDNCTNFRPLINLDGLEIMESTDYIARGKGNILLIEDFREPLKESGNSRAYEIVFEFSDTDRGIEAFTKALNEISRMEYDNEIDKDKYDECIKQIQDLFVNKDKSIDDLKEECEGTQVSDIAEKKDQEVGDLQEPKKKKKHIVEMLSVPRNHGFKGFRLNESGIYTRGNYILINEKGKIKAVHNKILKESTDSIAIFPEDSIEYKRLQEVCDKLNDMNLGYDFNVKETYFDMGQGWKWTTIIADNHKGGVLDSWQCCSPRLQEDIVELNLIDKAVEEISAQI